jgi:hypothetical protein
VTKAESVKVAYLLPYQSQKWSQRAHRDWVMNGGSEIIKSRLDADAGHSTTVRYSTSDNAMDNVDVYMFTCHRYKMVY